MNSFSKAVGGREKIHLSRLTGIGGGRTKELAG